MLSAMKTLAYLLTASLSGQMPTLPSTDPCLDISHVASVSAEYRDRGVPAGTVYAQAISGAVSPQDASRRIRAARFGYVYGDPEAAGLAAYQLCMLGRM